MIRNLIFDVGDVLVEYRWFEMLTRDYGLSEAEAKRIGEEMFDNEIWVQGLDGGRLSLEEAIHQYELKYPDDVDVMGWFLRNGEQMAVKRPEVWDKVAALKEKGYKIYLLSNYSEELLHVHTKGAKFLDVLDGGVVSYQVHALKPDREIYEILLEKYINFLVSVLNLYILLHFLRCVYTSPLLLNIHDPTLLLLYIFLMSMVL